MKDLFEVRFETKVVVASEKLPKGLTEPIVTIVDKLTGTFVEALKRYMNEDLKSDATENIKVNAK